MELYQVKNVSFTYPGRTGKALDNVSLSVSKGEFLCICGKSGCGKTTLLRLLKPAIAPHGDVHGEVLYDGTPAKTLDDYRQASEIGFVMQSPDNQIVCDKVWHELAFGLESLGCRTDEIRTRVFEMASFFGIENWFHKKVSELSGGQKQILSLASVMVMRPCAVLLDEPTSQLDPIAASEFFKMLEKINRELGTAVILSEHRLEEVFPIADRVIVMDGGKIIADQTPAKVGNILKQAENEMFAALPAPSQVFLTVTDSTDGEKVPVTVREGRKWLEEYTLNHQADRNALTCGSHDDNTCRAGGKNGDIAENAVELDEIRFRYEKNLPDILKGVSLKIKKGEFFALLGGNGAGKTTLLSVISALRVPYRGKVYINGNQPEKIKNLYDGVLGVLPQNPQNLFVKKTVLLDLAEMLDLQNISEEEKKKKILNVAKLCRISDLLPYHPYDLSGGEQQRAALAKVLLKNPEILLLDEPTKGLDAHFKRILAGILINLKRRGVTIIMVSHDTEFCAQYADRCSLMFDGAVTEPSGAREFFRANSFYTTAACRMAHTTIPEAVTSGDIIAVLTGKRIEFSWELSNGFPHGAGGENDGNDEYYDVCADSKDDKHGDSKSLDVDDSNGSAHSAAEGKNRDGTEHSDEKSEKENALWKGRKQVEKRKRISKAKMFAGVFCLVLFILSCVLHLATGKAVIVSDEFFPYLVIGELALSFVFLFTSKRKEEEIQISRANVPLTKKSLAAALFVLIAVPVTIFIGMFAFGDRKYYFISLLIILETILPFWVMFEKRKPRAREIVLISVLCAIGVAGRTAFFMVPQFKPVAALVIITGLCFGSQTGFLVGSVTGFVSNFFFGQGPWTPWQMLAYGLIGFISGGFFRYGFFRKTKAALCVFGFFATLILYGGVVNMASALMWIARPQGGSLLSVYAMGLPFDLIHAVSAAFFLWVAAESMIEKLERVKLKYGVMQL